MIIFMLLAIFITIACILFTAIVIVVYFVCYITDSLQSTQGSFKANFNGLISDTKISTLADTCIYVGGSGDLLTALGFDLTQTQKFTSLLDSATAIKSILTNLTSTTTPPVIGGISANFTQFSAFTATTLDSGVPSSQDLNAGVSGFNGMKCGSDTMQINTANCPAGSTKSATGDAASTSKLSNYCVAYPTYPTAFNSLTHNRYAAGDCTGSGGGTQANTYLTNTYKAISTFQSNIVSASSFADYSAAKNKEMALFTAMQTASTDMQAILTNMQKAADAVNRVGSSLSAAINCLILNKGIRIVENVLCYRTAGKLYVQSGVGAAVGFFLFLYSWCICCSLRLANKKEEGPADGQPTSTLKPYDEGAQSADPFPPINNEAQPFAGAPPNGFSGGFGQPNAGYGQPNAGYGAHNVGYQ